MRVKIRQDDLDRIFHKIKQQGITNNDLAGLLGVTARTITEWKKGNYSINSLVFKKMIYLAGIERSAVDYVELKDYWQNSRAGKKGAKVREQKHGFLGTPEGRKKGGENSYKKRRHIEEDIFAKKKIRTPEMSEELAEFIGIMIGDGTITNYQVSVALSSITDTDYSNYVASLFSSLFYVDTNILKRKTSNCITVTASSVELVNFLIGIGLLKGHKIKQGLDIPNWITEDSEFSKACIRGIFDTDGSVYQEIHKYKNRNYSYIRLAIVSASNNLRNTMLQILCNLEINAKIRNNRSVNIERLTDIETYFRVIGSSNPKHLRRWEQFGGVG